MADVSGLWSVYRVNVRPSRKCLKCLMALKAAKSSLSKALYFFSVSESFLEKNASGSQSLPMRCSSCAPTALLDASTVKLVGAPGFGWCNKTAAPKISLHLTNASWQASPQAICSVLFHLIACAMGPGQQLCWAENGGNSLSFQGSVVEHFDLWAQVRSVGL